MKVKRFNVTKKVKIIIAAVLMVAVLSGGLALYRFVPVKSDVFMPRPDSMVYYENGKKIRLSQPQIDAVYEGFLAMMQGSSFSSHVKDGAVEFPDIEIMQGKESHNNGKLRYSVNYAYLEFGYRRRQYYTGILGGHHVNIKEVVYDKIRIHFVSTLYKEGSGYYSWGNVQNEYKFNPKDKYESVMIFRRQLGTKMLGLPSASTLDLNVGLIGEHRLLREAIYRQVEIPIDYEVPAAKELSASY